jgi:methyl-accepting chemotaxis protein
VAAASEEQSRNSEQITKNIELITNVTQQSATGVRQIAHAAEDMSQLTVNLHKLISAFKVDASNLNVEDNKSKFSRSFVNENEVSIAEKTSFYAH